MIPNKLIDNQSEVYHALANVALARGDLNDANELRWLAWAAEKKERRDENEVAPDGVQTMTTGFWGKGEY